MAKTKAARGTATKKTGTARVSKPSVGRKPRLPKAVMLAVRAALEKKAEDVVVLDLRAADAFTDYFVVCTARNARQIGAIADSVRESLKTTLGEQPSLTEGAETSEWVLLDYFNFVVHVFTRECREFYGLERLWGTAVRHDMAEDPLAPAKNRS